MTNKRPNEAYEIEAVSKALRVLEAVESDTGQPIEFSRIVGRTGFTKDFVMRSLRTLELNGYVAKVAKNRWMYGKRLLRLFASNQS